MPSDSKMTKQPDPANLLNAARRVPLLALGAGLASVAGWLAYSAFAVKHDQPLPEAIPAERRTFAQRRAGILSYYVDRPRTDMTGAPLVLIHSINAAASAYEMRPIFQHYRGQRPVYALDLPGFGFSDRANRTYSPELYAEAILEFVQTQVRESRPVDVVALSLGSEFAARAALMQPERFRSLTLISPSGLAGENVPSGPQQASNGRGKDLLYRAFSFPLWAQGFYDLLATPPSIRYFLNMSFEGETDRGLIDYAYATAHRPGARNAPLYFVSGKLFTPDIQPSVYEKLPMPVLVLYDYDPFVNFDGLPGLLERNPNWQARRIVPTRGLPQFELMGEVADALDRFWAEAAQRTAQTAT